MNYYQYKRRAPRYQATDFIKPFLLIIIFVGIILTAWRFIGTEFIEGGNVISSEKVFLDIETGSAKAMTSGDGEWKNVPTGIYLYEGEKVKTQSDGRLTLTFFEKDTVRLDKSGELQLKTLSRDAIGGQAALQLNAGKIWVVIDKNSPIVSEFTIDTGLLSLKSSGGTFAVVNPGMLYVISGSVKAEILSEGKVVKTSTIGVGQELVADETIAADLATGIQKEVIFALDDTFKSSNWYRWNQQQKGAVTLNGEDVSSDAEESDGTTPDEEVLSETGTKEAIEEEELANEIDENDKEAPSQPQIKEPGANGETVILEDIEEIIIGTVSADTEGVIVNDYRLTQYKPGSGKFSYYAKTAYGNLKVGDNEYKVIAVDKAGNKSETAVITLTLTQEVVDKTKPEEEETTTESAPEATATGGVKITSPNNGENLVTSETSFEIKGEVPAGTAKVVVNDYTLQGFSEGGTTFLYRASSTLGTLEIGELNTYTVKAYDADDKLLGTASMTIDVESSQTGVGDPVITMPTSASTYTTTLDQLVIGGAVGKWVEMVYLNGEPIHEYIPGSEQWKKTVNLNPGENVLSVYGKKNGEQTSTVTITINYQN
ncbi:FecR domain-containing protein [Patescibacteria group bacterium]|nr:FecR domain-containing protein [Patescibacteria group bacterium]MBU1015849.1 FecR domain-containing protein [Patescibacteria group bacterium]MBU1685402.1 FecR domain-containing protein [Patescibacteria group bacterium]MBU1938439.1 FecR domain-containing protein [Patescibacteria group bacterium]